MCQNDSSSSPDFRELCNREPQVISLTLFRKKGQRLGIKLDKNGENGGGDVFVAALDGRKDSLLCSDTISIRVGDLLTEFNNQACYGVDLETLKFTITQTTGLCTFTLRKTSSAALQDKVRQAIFISPKAHTCLPMEIDFCKEKALKIANLNPQNPWLMNSCLSQGQIVLSINGTSSHQLEEEDAQIFLQTKNELEPTLSIKTFTPSSSIIPRVHSFSSTGTASTDDSETRRTTSYKERMQTMLRRTRASPCGDENEADSKLREKMEAYLKKQNGRFQEMLQEAQLNVEVDSNGELPVFSSCRKVFIAMKQNINVCKKVDTGKYFFQLCQMFAQVLIQYAQILSDAPMTIKSLRNPRLHKLKSMISASPSISLAANGEQTLCHVIATSSYCANTVELIEELIQETISEKYNLQIDMSETQEAFENVSAKAMALLVSGLHDRLVKSAFSVMGKLSWSSWDAVEDTNEYAYAICQTIQAYTETTRDLLPSAYYRSFCDKVVLDVADTFFNTMISKCNRASSPGKQQLLLDVYTIKTYLLKLLVQKSKDVKKKKASFSESSLLFFEKMVLEKFLKIESLLKMAACSDANFDVLLNDAI